MGKGRAIFGLVVAALLVVGPANAETRAFARADASGEPRVALVIGNNAYRYVARLNNAVSDALAVRRELEQRHFQVIYREDATRHTMNDAINEFVGKLSSESIGLVYFSGHGVQINGANYLIPIDLEAEKAADVDNDAIELGRLLDRVSQTQAKFTLAIIDACRNNPFQGGGRAIGGRGLAPPVSNASGIMVVYSAGANQEALDRLGGADRDPNGLFTREFLKAMRMPGLKVQDAVTAVKMAVIEQAKSVGHVQTPAIYDQSVGTFYFSEPAAADQAPIAIPAPTAPPDRDALFWQSIQASRQIADFDAYLKQFPNGTFADLARHRIEALTPPRTVAIVPAVPSPAAKGPTAVPDGSSVASNLFGRYPEASFRSIDPRDLADRPCRDLKIMRNEIYARHGYIFKTAEMRAHFAAESWYRPTREQVDTLLSAIERHNVQAIQTSEQTCRN